MTRIQKKYTILILYCLCFFAVWTVFELFIKPQIDSQLLRTVVIKNTVWVLPAMLLVHALSGDVQVGLKEMFVTKVKWWRYLWVYALLAVWALLGGIFQPGGLTFELTFNELVIVLFVGITEEMVFRGWLLNATVKYLPPWLAILINAVLFMVIHFPRFIMEGTFIHEFTSFANVGLMVFSAILSISFLKSKNLLIPITMHMLYDLLMFVFGF